jgi:hypothetical protein
MGVIFAMSAKRDNSVTPPFWRSLMKIKTNLRAGSAGAKKKKPPKKH